MRCIRQRQFRTSIPRTRGNPPTRAIMAERPHPLVCWALLHRGLDEHFTARPSVVRLPVHEHGDSTPQHSRSRPRRSASRGPHRPSLVRVLLKDRPGHLPRLRVDGRQETVVAPCSLEMVLAVVHPCRDEHDRGGDGAVTIAPIVPSGPSGAHPAIRLAVSTTIAVLSNALSPSS